MNTHKGFGAFNRRYVLHDLREAVRSVSADVVFLQEVLGSHERHAARHKLWASEPQYEFLADAMWTDFAYGRNAVYPHGHHGNAVLSKFPIVHHQNHDISVGQGEKRGLLHCILDVPHAAHQMHAICVHLDLTEAHRQAQLKLLCKLVAEQIPPEAPLVVAGDFNDWRMKAHDVMASCPGLREVFIDHHGRPAKTFPARWPLLPLDRIYVRHMAVRRPLVMPNRPWSHLSDHAPLAAELRL